MKKNLKLKALAVAVLAVIGAQSAMADISENANITILANNDNSGSTPTYSEGVFIRSNEGNAATATFQSNGTASINGTNTSLTGVTTLINAAGNLTLTGNTDNTEGNEGVRIKSNTAGAASINLQTNGMAYINASSQIRINAEPDTSTGAVLIGNGRGNNSISGVTNSISGCRRLTIDFLRASYRSRFRCAWNSSKITPCGRNPCFVLASDEITL